MSKIALWKKISGTVVAIGALVLVVLMCVYETTHVFYWVPVTITCLVAGASTLLYSVLDENDTRTRE